jgi:hypothetical protein
MLASAQEVMIPLILAFNQLPHQVLRLKEQLIERDKDLKAKATSHPVHSKKSFGLHCWRRSGQQTTRTSWGGWGGWGA